MKGPECQDEELLEGSREPAESVRKQKKVVGGSAPEKCHSSGQMVAA